MQLEELRTRVDWYEGRLNDLECTQQPQQPAGAVPVCHAAASPTDTISPCALQPPLSLTAGSHPHGGAEPAGHVLQHGLPSLYDAPGIDSQPNAPDTDAHACVEEVETQQTLNDLLAPSDYETTPRDVSSQKPPGNATHAASAAAGRFDASSENSPGHSCDNSSTLSFEDGENTPQFNLGGGSQAKAYAPAGEVQEKLSVPRPACFSTRSLRVGKQKVPEGPFTTDPCSPGSLPLGKSVRATSSRGRRAVAPTSFGNASAATATATAEGGDSHVGSRAAACSVSFQQHTKTSDPASQKAAAAPSSRHESSRENCAPLGFGLGPADESKSMLSSPQTLVACSKHTDDRSAPTRRAGEEAAVLATACESAARAPLSSITNQNADAADSAAAPVPAATDSKSAAAEEPFPHAVDASAACNRRPGSSRAQASAQIAPSCMHGVHASAAKDFDVSASVQVCISQPLSCMQCSSIPSVHARRSR